MERIGDGIYKYNGAKLKVVSGVCRDCCLHGGNKGCGFNGYKCYDLIGPSGIIFIKYEEPKVEKIKLADVSFKCVVPGRDVEEKIARSLCEKGLIPSGMIASIGACFMMFHSEGLNSHSDASRFCQWPQPLVSWQQALDLIATVEKPEPVFDIKRGDEVLCRDLSGDRWEIKHFAIFREARSGHTFKTYGASYGKMIKFAGNEQYHDSENTPSGWWEAKDGKPVWVTK